MARLESVARAGYFPTPLRVAEILARHLGPSTGASKRVIRLLDPCAGTGEAAAVLARSLGAESFGIEVNEERATSATRCWTTCCMSSAKLKSPSGATESPRQVTP
jgi:type I restriction-modification system DNA methylase subunit